MIAVAIWTLVFLALAYVCRGFWPVEKPAPGCGTQCGCSKPTSSHD
ncbi:MAG: hypothetical protein O3B20_05005 [Bacteroidetes bacterium]|nr:hypothetical protein [Bacteroidota bacterium]